MILLGGCVVDSDRPVVSEVHDDRNIFSGDGHGRQMVVRIVKVSKKSVLTGGHSWWCFLDWA